MLSRDQILASMRERVHHPAGVRELLQLLKVPRDERTSFKRHINALVASGDSSRFAGSASACPKRWTSMSAGCRRTRPATASSLRSVRSKGGGDIYISGPHLNEAMHGDRVVVRIERIKDGGRVEGRIIRILERSNTWIVGRYDRGDDGMGYVVPFDRRVLMDIFVPPGQEGGASPARWSSVELTRWPTSTRGAIGRVAEVLGDIDAPGRRHRDHHPQVRHSRRALARRRSTRRCGSGTAVSERDIRGRTDFRDQLRRSRSTASTRAISTTRSRSRSCRTATTGWACTSPTSRITCRRAARSIAKAYERGDVGVFPRARGPHVPVGAGDRAVQPQSARRPAGAVVPDGGRSPRRRSCATSFTTASSTATSG